MYRYQSVDFLKFLAISSVFFYHLYPDTFEGGLIGVDVFLIVTGYLSAMTLEKRTAIDFVINRFLRIYPALSFLMIATFLFIISFGFYSEIFNFAKYFISTTLLLTNLHLYLDNGYFSSGIASNLLYHLWSISLEFQTWVIFAVFAFFFPNSGKKVIMILMIISFIFSLYFLFNGNIDAFYLNPFVRFWEPALGYLIYTFQAKRGEHYPLGSYAFIFFSGFIALISLLDLKAHFLVWIITPILVSAALFFGLEIKGKVERVIRYFSLRTYAIYLSHLPIIVAFSYYFPLVGVQKAIVVTFVTLVFSEFIYRVVENGD